MKCAIENDNLFNVLPKYAACSGLNCVLHKMNMLKA